MGSWSDLDAIYPPGTLSPASGLVVAIGHLLGAPSVYAAPHHGAPWVPEVFQTDQAVLARAEYWLHQPTARFWAEVRDRLFPQQRMVIALQLFDRASLSGIPPIICDELVAQLCLNSPDLAVYRVAIARKNDLSLFPQ